MSGGRGRIVGCALALAVGVAVASAPAGAADPTVVISGTSLGHTEIPDRTLPIPGDDVVAAVTTCEAEARTIPGFGQGATFAVAPDGSYSGLLVAGCDYTVLPVASPCGPMVFGASQLVSASGPVEVDLVFEFTPMGQPSEPPGDPSPGHTMTVVDTTRGIDVWPCRFSTRRTLRSTVMIPDVGEGPFPVVVLAHGIGETRFSVQGTATDHRAGGYIVVAPTFPVVSMNAQQETKPDIRNQPGDVSFVVRAVLDAANTPGDPLFGKVDAERIGIDGVSGGAVTSLLFFNDCCRDPRIKAVAADLGYFPPAAELGTPYRFKHRLPLFMSNNVDDVLIPYERALGGWQQARPDKFLASEEYEHCPTPALAHCTSAEGRAGEDLFFDAYLKDDAGAKAELIEIFQTSTGTVARQYEVGSGKPKRY